MKTRWLVPVLILACAASAGAVEITLKDADMRLQLYGYIRADLSHDSQATAPKADFAFWVLPELDGEKDAQTHLGARETRVGLNLFGPDAGDWKTTGKIEVDFYGSGNPNSYSPRIRLAYLDLAHSSGLSIRAGQDWETFVEVIPRIVNFAYLADIGALGLRRPQARVTQELKISETTKLVAKAAVAQTVGEDLDGGGFDDGADADWPTFQFNVALHQKLWAEKSARFAFSGHYGRETLDAAVSNAVTGLDAEDYDTWSAQGSVYLPLTKCLAVQGNLWTGENLDTYYGGIGQGVNMGLGEAVASKGGWAQLLYDPTEKLCFGLGYSMDDPDDDDLSPGMRAKNQQAFVNGFYKLTPAVTVMAEYANMTTDYVDGDEACNNRVQVAIRYAF
ncbi:MAG TPA: porin [Kiritimatiellia bacterium]|nr:porin [Kiritimatiellia bacterium]HPR69564.1 porin [Kiritimatiellia bacterium]